MIPHDRAALVVQTFFDSVGLTPHPTLRRYLENLLRDEFFDERRQAVADRTFGDQQ
jgi:hypothetical protein